MVILRRMLWTVPVVMIATTVGTSVEGAVTLWVESMKISPSCAGTFGCPLIATLDKTWWTTKCKAIHPDTYMIRVDECDYFTNLIIGECGAGKGKQSDYFKPAAGKSYCEMLTSTANHMWSPDGETWTTPAYVIPPADTRYFSVSGGGSAADWPKGNDGGDDRKYLMFWGNSNLAGGCCQGGGSSTFFSIATPFKMHIYADHEAHPKGYTYTTLATVIVPPIVPFGEVPLGTVFWSKECKKIPGNAAFVILTMGHVKDMFKPIDGASFCDMLTSKTKHLFSNDGEKWVTPNYDVATDDGTGYYPNALGLGGSEGNWPQNNVAGDARRFLSYWGSDAEPTHGIIPPGGCCSYFDHHELEKSSSWGKDFTMEYAIPDATSTSTTTVPVTTITTNPCDGKDCGNGKCNSNGICECTAGWEGADCKTNVNECADQDCGNGSCKDLVNGFECECTAGWEGSGCKTNVNECADQDCGNGSCKDLVNSFECECTAGWEGADCKTNVNECADKDCGNGSCKDEINAHTCVCNTGWGGSNCKIAGGCTVGGNGQACVNAGAATGRTGQCKCDCVNGYTGANCEIAPITATATTITATVTTVTTVGTTPKTLTTITATPTIVTTSPCAREGYGIISEDERPTRPCYKDEICGNNYRHSIVQGQCGCVCSDAGFLPNSGGSIHKWNQHVSYAGPCVQSWLPSDVSGAVKAAHCNVGNPAPATTIAPTPPSPPPTTTTITTTTATTTTEYNKENVDCVEEQDTCTAACEAGIQRSYTLIKPAAANGRACVGATDCKPGDGLCPLQSKLNPTPTPTSQPAADTNGSSAGTGNGTGSKKTDNSTYNNSETTSNTAGIAETQKAKRVGGGIAAAITIVLLLLAVGVAAFFYRRKQQHDAEATAGAADDAHAAAQLTVANPTFVGAAGAAGRRNTNTVIVVGSNNQSFIVPMEEAADAADAANQPADGDGTGGGAAAAVGGASGTGVYYTAPVAAQSVAYELNLVPGASEHGRAAGAAPADANYAEIDEEVTDGPQPAHPHLAADGYVVDEYVAKNNDGYVEDGYVNRSQGIVYAVPLEDGPANLPDEKVYATAADAPNSSTDA